MATPTSATNPYKVRLIPISSLTSGADPAAVRASQVTFEATPTLAESGSVEYTAVTPVHMPGSMQVYKHTNSRQFEITAHFISRNVADAVRHMQNVQKLRAWRYPYFGSTDTLTDANNQARANQATPADSSGLSDQEREQQAADRAQAAGVQLRGAPPDILYLYAYSNSARDNRSSKTVWLPTNLNRIPVVMSNLSITYPDDVDYIPVSQLTPSGLPMDPNNTTTQPWPIKIDVSITLLETHSPAEFESFDLNAYKLGNLATF